MEPDNRKSEKMMRLLRLLLRLICLGLIWQIVKSANGAGEFMKSAPDLRQAVILGAAWLYGTAEFFSHAARKIFRARPMFRYFAVFVSCYLGELVGLVLIRMAAELFNSARFLGRFADIYGGIDVGLLDSLLTTFPAVALLSTLLSFIDTAMKTNAETPEPKPS